MSETPPDVVVLREGSEGLSMESYAEVLCERLPEFEVALARTPADERRLVAEAPVVTGVGIDEALLEQAKNLRLFACAFSGIDHLPVDSLRERGVVVTNASGIHAPGIAEQVVGSILIFSRRLDRGIRQQSRGVWHHYQSDELTGKTVTVVGLGSIGHAVVERLQGFGVRTIGVRYTPSKGGPTDEVCGFDEDAFYDAASRTDYLVLACPLTDVTRGLVDESVLATLPPSAVVINVARGPIVDTDALVAALRTNSITGASLDVTDPEPLPSNHPLWRLNNALITPHTGGHTPHHWPRLADIVSENARKLRHDRPTSELTNVVLSS